MAFDADLKIFIYSYSILLFTVVKCISMRAHVMPKEGRKKKSRDYICLFVFVISYVFLILFYCVIYMVMRKMRKKRKTKKEENLFVKAEIKIRGKFVNPIFFLPSFFHK